MDRRTFNKRLREAIAPLEKTLLSEYYFSLQDYLTFPEKLKMLWAYVHLQTRSVTDSEHAEISFMLYSKACERLLLPLFYALMNRPEVKSGALKVNLIVLGGIHQLKLTSANLERIEALNFQIETDYRSLIKACQSPQNKLVMVCLDHRKAYQYHKCGVDTVDKLKACSVKTATIQHGGTRSDSVQELSSAASDVIMVWGQRVERDLHQYGVTPDRVKAVGNPLHDRLKLLDREQAEKIFTQLYPEIQNQLETKKVVLLATCLHSEYQGREQEEQLYETYMRHIYQSIDFNKVLLFIKMHPLDKKEPNLYQTALPNAIAIDSTVIIGADVTELDIYQLVMISDVVLTRASTVGEESLMLGKKVIAFDLFSDGPSKGYAHLAEYGSHTTVYAEPAESLKNALDQALSSPQPDAQNQANIVADLTCALDGKSTERAIEVLLSQVSTI
jgi:CDP-glycerol glycerophosphotransferase (TagB/SpsB family)